MPTDKQRKLNSEKSESVSAGSESNGDESFTFGNVYTKIPKKFILPEIHYDNEEQMHWQLPSMNLIVGPTGAGKTNICYDLIHKATRGKHPAFEEIYLFAANLKEPIWAWIIERSQEVKKRNGPQVLWYSNRLYDLPSVTSFQDIPKEKKTSKVIIIDDFVNASDAEMQKVEDWMKMGRKELATVIFLTQSFFRTNKFVRDQTRYIWIRGIGNETDLNAIARTFPQLVDKEVLSEIYHNAVTPWPNALCIDTQSKDVNETFRRTYTPINIDKYLDEDVARFQEGSKGEKSSHIKKDKRKAEDMEEGEGVKEYEPEVDENKEGAIEWLERITGFRQPEKRVKRG